MYGARFAEEERVIQRDGGNFVAWHLLSARTRLLSIYLSIVLRDQPNVHLKPKRFMHIPL